MEYHDGKPVTRHEAWFRKKTFEVPEHDARWLGEDRVGIWAVLGVSRDSSYAKRKDDPDSKVRTAIVEIDTAIVLTGDLREQVARRIADGETRGDVVDQASDLELDRLDGYLRSRWLAHINDADNESPVDIAIRLLDQGDPGSILPGRVEPFLQEEEEPEVEVIGRIRGYREELEASLRNEYREEDTPRPPLDYWPTDEDSVSVVGSVYRNGSKTRALLEKAFGD